MCMIQPKTEEMKFVMVELNAYENCNLSINYSEIMNGNEYT
jgi:hypothetical protein